MKKMLLLIIIMFVFCGLVAMASGKMQRIVTKDNSVILGKVLSMQDGVYTVESSTLGTLSLKADNIVEISAIDETNRSSPSGATSDKIRIRDGSRKSANEKSLARKKYESSNSSVGSDNISSQQEEVNARVNSMAMNGDSLDAIMNLSGNETMLNVMDDPEIMDAISGGDYDFLMNSEKMKNLMESDDIKSLLGGY